MATVRAGKIPPDGLVLLYHLYCDDCICVLGELEMSKDELTPQEEAVKNYLEKQAAEVRGYVTEWITNNLKKKAA